MKNFWFIIFSSIIFNYRRSSIMINDKNSQIQHDKIIGTPEMYSLKEVTFILTVLYAVSFIIPYNTT